MKWKQFRLKTTTQAEDIVSSMLADLGIEGVQIEDKIALRCRKCGSEVVYLVTLDLSVIQITFNLHFQHITAPTHFYRLFHNYHPHVLCDCLSL